MLVYFGFHIETYFDLAHSEGRSRHVLPSLSRSQPVVAVEGIVCWGTLPIVFALFAFCHY